MSVPFYLSDKLIYNKVKMNENEVYSLCPLHTEAQAQVHIQAQDLTRAREATAAEATRVTAAVAVTAHTAPRAGAAVPIRGGPLRRR